MAVKKTQHRVPGIHGAQKAGEPGYLQWEVVVCTFSNTQRLNPWQNVLDATKWNQKGLALAFQEAALDSAC